jgi:hypothetical protein
VDQSSHSPFKSGSDDRETLAFSAFVESMISWSTDFGPDASTDCDFLTIADNLFVYNSGWNSGSANAGGDFGEWGNQEAEAQP